VETRTPNPLVPEKDVAIARLERAGSARWCCRRSPRLLMRPASRMHVSPASRPSPQPSRGCAQSPLPRLRQAHQTDIKRPKQVFSLEMGTETLSDSILTIRKPLGKSIDNFLVQGKVLCCDRARFKPAGIFKPFLNNLAAIYLVFDDPLQPIPD